MIKNTYFRPMHFNECSIQNSIYDGNKIFFIFYDTDNNCIDVLHDIYNQCINTSFLMLCHIIKYTGIRLHITKKNNMNIQLINPADIPVRVYQHIIQFTIAYNMFIQKYCSKYAWNDFNTLYIATQKMQSIIK